MWINNLTNKTHMLRYLRCEALSPWRTLRISLFWCLPDIFYWVQLTWKKRVEHMRCHEYVLLLWTSQWICDFYVGWFWFDVFVLNRMNAGRSQNKHQIQVDGSIKELSSFIACSEALERPGLGSFPDSWSRCVCSMTEAAVLGPAWIPRTDKRCTQQTSADVKDMFDTL